MLSSLISAIASGDSATIGTTLIVFLFYLVAILLSLSVHESAHGFAAYKCGDATAKNLGRITLNPIKHIDPLGFLCMMVAGFGWAKPVPVNSRNLNKPRRDMAIVSVAGPYLKSFACGFIRCNIQDHLRPAQRGYRKVLPRIKCLCIYPYDLRRAVHFDYDNDKRYFGDIQSFARASS